MESKDTELDASADVGVDAAAVAHEVEAEDTKLAPQTPDDETTILAGETTELADARAWSDTEAGPTEPAPYVEGRRTSRWVFAALAVMLPLIALVALGTMFLQTRHGASTRAPSTAAPPAAVLDGTYRLAYDFEKETQNGAPAPQPNTNNTSWWAFRSVCTSTRCAATGARLDDYSHRTARTPADTANFHFADGHWQATLGPRQVLQQRCLGADGQVIAGTNTELLALSLKPHQDGALVGVLTRTALTNECGFQGTVAQAPFVATRMGDVPPGVSVADPATVAPATTSTPAQLGGPALEGIYHLDYDDANQTYNGTPATGTTTRETEWWAFRSLCAPTGCFATGTKLSDTNHEKAVGVAHVLRFVDTRWEDTPYLQPLAPCPGTDGSSTKNETHSWSLEPQSDGRLRGAETITALRSDCSKQGTMWRTPMELTWVSDLPSTVTVADPALFAAPPTRINDGPR
jgi:serine/threonine-protein kinase